MEIFLIIILSVVLVGVVLFWFVMRQKSSKVDGQALVMLQNQISDMRNELNRTLDAKLGESTKVLQRQFSEGNKVIRDVTEHLTKLGETNKQVVGFAEQLRGLQDILKNPKQRGVLGEYYLETVLKNILPPGSYKMQYEFKDGSVVDAVIFVKDQIVPIDSKFSLENYNRLIETHDEAERKRFEDAFRNDLKNRIDETAKYIKPSEKTMEFALMFIPSEAVFYDLLINKVGSLVSRDLVEYAVSEKRVIPVSPTSFAAYLQTILQGLKALQVEESAKEIRKGVEKLQRHLMSYETYMKKLGTNLGTTVNMYNHAYKELGKVDKDVLKITGKGSEMEPTLLDGPVKDEE